jgi:hypothetical protein
VVKGEVVGELETACLTRGSACLLPER